MSAFNINNYFRHQGDALSQCFAEVAQSGKERKYFIIWQIKTTISCTLHTLSRSDSINKTPAGPTSRTLVSSDSV